MLALATMPFLFDRGFTIYGGNIPSTLAGEFSFSISLSFALLFLGVVARGLDTGRNRALGAVLLALTGLSHLLPTVFAVVGALPPLPAAPGPGPAEVPRRAARGGGAHRRLLVVPVRHAPGLRQQHGLGEDHPVQREPVPPEQGLAVAGAGPRGRGVRGRHAPPGGAVPGGHGRHQRRRCSSSPPPAGCGTPGSCPSGSSASTCWPAWPSPRSAPPWAASSPPTPVSSPPG